MEEKKKRDPKKKAVNGGASKESHYVDNDKFCVAMSDYFHRFQEAKKNGEGRPQLCNYAGSCLVQICERLSTRPNFIHYPYREEMVSDAIENCLQYAHNFDPSKSSNPFSYFTQIAYYAFLRRIEKEKRQDEIKYHIIRSQDTGHFSDLLKESGMVSHDSDHALGEFLGVTPQAIDKFEENIAKKMDKQKKKGKP
jgi:DNA-directed RNA polymerase specialized sigma24 family protein